MNPSTKRPNEDDDGEGGQPAPADRWTLSEDYRSDDADVELRSSDRVRFLVHKANLAGVSKTFADMFASTSSSSSSSIPVLDLTEPSYLIALFLPYCYPQRVEPFFVYTEAPEMNIESFAVFDKYEIWRGLEAIEAAIGAWVPIRRSDSFTTPLLELESFGFYTVVYAFANHFNRSELSERIFYYYLDAFSDIDGDRKMVQAVKLGFLGDAEELISKATSRLYEISLLRERHLAELLDCMALLSKVDYCWQQFKEEVERETLLNIWFESRTVATSGSLRRFAQERTSRMPLHMCISCRELLESRLQRLSKDIWLLE